MDYLYSFTGSGPVRVVRDAISQRLWPGPGQETVLIPQHHARTTHDRNTEHFKTAEVWVHGNKLSVEQPLFLAADGGQTGGAL
ncbi:V-type proton ATPase 116 kDa subunit a isoform 1 [Dissostichus eleginoides]|uniref:V-type proton ATPase 116 kDa subunit a isoform 1 n=1 Tax=Dissostichus eleginoides TaxID=100907 RepID=A0AAD9C5T3_DISEL|nr:V-type proton ATPase 116 kDa subunit a isoform 1 [Dissostichus eleginoides]